MMQTKNKIYKENYTKAYHNYLKLGMMRKYQKNQRKQIMQRKGTNDNFLPGKQYKSDGSGTTFL